MAAPRRRTGQHRSKIASTVLPVGARWAAIAAAAACAVLALTAGASTPLLKALPFLALPMAVAAAFHLSRAFDFAIGHKATGRSLPTAMSLAAFLGLLWVASSFLLQDALPGTLLPAVIAAFGSGLLIQPSAAATYDHLRRRGVFN